MLQHIKFVQMLHQIKCDQMLDHIKYDQMLHQIKCDHMGRQ